MRKKLYNLAKLYPKLMKIETAADRYGIHHEVKCGDEL